ncbi:nucleotidyltransferase family protein [uncultured Tissierella sp.]|uniref:nucleotidyltransferase family protein n=1 Tax=uncultured Tissierella sp. TaxID=448160 RepID=UPI00280375AC|nr:nucleotidyltransferase family protein [uncultured Tissierella sp.]MDU5083286.1 nucleotidyltransferase family protein [Bacillota bacterium]
MIIGIILASGFSRRMKADKLLIDIEGSTLIERVIKACVGSKLDDIILIYRSEEVKKIGEEYNIKTIYNENAHLGQSEGLKLGVRRAIEAKSYMFLVGDQPFLTSELIDKLIEEYNISDLPILVPYYNNHRGMPMLISSIFKEELLQITGDKGGRDIVERNISKTKKVYIEEERLGMDIDNQEDLKILEITK